MAEASVVGSSPAVDRIAQTAASLRDLLAECVIDTLAAFDAVRLAELLAKTERACAYARAKAGLRATDMGAHRLAGVANPVEWLAAQAGGTAGEARAALKLAEVADNSPAVADALAAGDISVGQAAEIVRTAKDLPGSESELIHAATGASLDQLRDTARHRRLEAVSPELLHDRQRRLRAVKHWTDADGMIAVLHTLLPEIGLPYVKRLEAEATKRHRHARADGSDEPFAAHMADAFAQLVGLDPSGPTPTNRRSANVELSVVVDRNALLRGYAEGGEVCHIIGGGPIPVEVAKQLAADAFLQGVLFDGTDILAIKRFGRNYPVALMAALNLGDPPTFTGRRCRRCGSVFRLQRDHIDPVANGGLTWVDNIGWLCDPCHLVKTEEDRRAGLLGPNPPTRTAIKNRTRNRPAPRRAPPLVELPLDDSG